MPDSPKLQPPPYPGKWARRREIILHSLARRLIFLAGLVVLALVIVLVRFWP